MKRRDRARTTTRPKCASWPRRPSRLIAGGRTVGTAESLTGGMLAAALTAVPGASAVFRGGVVAYATELKATLLGVPAGPAGSARRGASGRGCGHGRRRVPPAGRGVGVATTGVAGPDPADGEPVGTVLHRRQLPGAARPEAADGVRALRCSAAQIRDRDQAATWRSALRLILVRDLAGREYVITALRHQTRGYAVSRTVHEARYGGGSGTGLGRESGDGSASSLAR